VLRILDNLEDWYRDGHYRPSPLLRRAALAERGLAARESLLPSPGHSGREEGQ
jgi:hypothetical protein